MPLPVDHCSGKIVSGNNCCCCSDPGSRSCSHSIGICSSLVEEASTYTAAAASAATAAVNVSSTFALHQRHWRCSNNENSSSED